jgi:hypothetical protein
MHDGYPRHQHSINGALTIHPQDSQPHFAGMPFRDPRQADQPFCDWESEHCWKTADHVGNLLICYRRELAKEERQVLSDAMQVLMKLGGKVKRGEIKR